MTIQIDHVPTWHEVFQYFLVHPVLATIIAITAFVLFVYIWAKLYFIKVRWMDGVNWKREIDEAVGLLDRDLIRLNEEESLIIGFLSYSLMVYPRLEPLMAPVASRSRTSSWDSG